MVLDAYQLDELAKGHLGVLIHRVRRDLHLGVLRDICPELGCAVQHHQASSGAAGRLAELEKLSEGTTRAVCVKGCRRG